jgi:hypothetical protein
VAKQRYSRLVTKPKTLQRRELGRIAQREIAASQTYDKTELADDRKLAVEYVNGKMTKWPAEKGRSSVVDMTVSTTLGWMLPGIIRMFTASFTMAIAEPTEPRDDQWSKQATDGINYAFWKDNPGYEILHDGTYDALLHGNAIVKHWWDDTPTVKISFHTGLDEQALQTLLNPEDLATDEDGKPCEEIEVISIEQSLYDLQPGDQGYADPAGQGMPAGDIPPMPVQPAPMAEPAPRPDMTAMLPPQQLAKLKPGDALPPNKAFLYDVKIRRTSRYGKIGLMIVAPEDFLISDEAVSIHRARLRGHKQQKTRSELIEMGFDEAKVMGLNPTQDDDDTQQSRRDDGGGSTVATATKELEEVTLYELYVQVDQDMDNVAETLQLFYCADNGPGESGVLLEWSLWEDEEIFSEIQTYRVPHRWKADGIYKKTADIQEIRTVLTRQGLDNIYATNNPMWHAKGRLSNPDALSNPQFGQVVVGDADSEVVALTVPFMGDVALKGLEFFDQVLERRTGVSRTTMALDPEAIQGQTATAAQLAHDSSYSQIELVGRNHAEMGWNSVFRNILKLMIRHQDRARQIRIDDKWTEIDPRHWNADMHVTINTGLGTGSRDRDLAVLSSMKADMVSYAGLLREAQMPGKALEMVPAINAALQKSAEAAGIRKPEQFYPEINQDDLKQAAEAIQKKNSQPPMELQIIDKQVQASLQEAQIKVQSDASKEAAQMQADLQVKDKEMQRDLIVAGNQQAFEREKLAQDSMEREKDRALQIALKQMDIASHERVAAEQRVHDFHNKSEDRAFKADLESRKASQSAQ